MPRPGVQQLGMKHTSDARTGLLLGALLSGVGVATLLLAPAGCASSEKRSDDNAAALPQDNSPPPDQETIRQIQRERAAERSYAK